MSGDSHTVTLLFTDLESSTGRWDIDGARMPAAVAEHDSVRCSTISAHGGEVFKHYELFSIAPSVLAASVAS